MSAKTTILILCDWFLPGYLAGGPIQSIATLTKQLGTDVDFKIITTDRDFKSNTAYQNIKTNEWTSYEGRTVFYVSPENMNPKFILKLIQSTPHHTLYLNSLFSKIFTIYPLKWKQQHKIDSVIVLAPRGMLRDGALAVKPFKKQAFLLYAKLTGLFKQVHWQSTSAEETKEIKQRIGSNAVITEVANFPEPANDIISIQKKKGELRLCFIARILGIKNLDFALEVLKNIKNHTIVFDVFGPQEDPPYWNMCLDKVKLLPSNISFDYKGSLKPEEVGPTLNKYHALFLPTQTENFGHVIVQSLIHGRPVIISDNTPWRQLKNANAGADIALTDMPGFILAINKLLDLEQHSFDEMSKSSAAYIQTKLNIEDIKQKYLTIFRS